MGYNRFIKYGETFELYEYDREPLPARKRTTRVRHDDDGDSNMGADGKDSLSERQLGKRRDNAKSAAMAFRRLVSSNLTGTEPPILVSLTYAENQEDLSIGYADFRSFIQALRYKFGKAFRYVCVPEFQARGAVHFHALFWGLPFELVSQERSTRTIAMMWGHGFIDMIPTDGHEKISSYLAKYMSKAFTDPRLRNQKAYTASRNVLRPTVGKGFAPVWPVLDDYVGNSPIVMQKTYWTKYLGNCKYTVYQILKDK